MKKLVLITIVFFSCLLKVNAQAAPQKTASQKAIPAGQPTNVLPPVKKPEPKTEPKRVDMRMKVPTHNAVPAKK